MDPDNRRLLDGSLSGGIYRAIGPCADVVDALHRAGWRSASMSQADTLPEFLRSIGVALRFPDWYGHNLDALVDCLRDLDEPTALLWSSWHELAIEHPADWAEVMDVLAARSRVEPPFALVLA